VAAAYVLLGIISRNTVFPGAGVSMVWLPAGFGVGVLTRADRRLLPVLVPALMIAEFSADFWIFGFSLEGSLVFTAANILEQGLLATVFRTAGLKRLDTARQLVPLALITGAVVLVTAMFGGLASVLTFGSDYGQAWLTWYLGSVTSVVLMTPFVLTVGLPEPARRTPWVEAAVMVGGTLALSVLVFTQTVLRGPFAPFAALLVPLLAWVGVRLGFAVVTAVAPVVVFIAAVAAAQSRGPFMGTVPDLQLLLWLQAFMVLACLTIYATALVDSDRRRARAEQALALDKLAFQARHDHLTGLLNRFGLAERISGRDDALEQAGLAVLFCDLDGFKELNDVAGHRVGDTVLRRVAERIIDLVPQTGDVARLGGDEFVVVQSLADSRPAESVAADIQQRLKRPIEVDGQEYDIGVSIGVAELTAGEIVPGSVEDLIRRADVALQEAKDTRGVTRSYRSSMDDRRHAERETRAQLSVALDNQDVVSWFQPLVELATGRVCGAEALARMRLPEGGVVGPDVFIPVAESSRLIIPLGRTMICQGLQFAATRAREDPSFSVAVNVSTRELLHDHYVTFLLAEVRRSGLRPQNLHVEVTEQVIMDAAGTVPRVLHRLSDEGFGVVLDDFGTGFSSLTALRELPAGTIKIDRRFIARMCSVNEDRAIARGVIQVSRDLGRTVVAEGVESREQWELLLQWGCHLGQGNLLGPPAPASRFDAQLRQLGQIG
jgi:diguanylate cyclase (GGDEF)-like protein